MEYPALVGWSVRIDGSSLKLSRPPVKREIALTPSQLAGLIETLERERVFELDKSYGTFRGNSNFRTLDVWLNGKYKRVWIGEDLGAEIRRDGLERALRVWIAIRSLFEDDIAIDTREEDKALLGPGPSPP